MLGLKAATTQLLNHVKVEVEAASNSWVLNAVVKIMNLQRFSHLSGGKYQFVNLKGKKTSQT